MKELQKYYASETHEWVHPRCDTACDAVYLASEADAAFAEMRREHAEEIESLRVQQQLDMKPVSEAMRRMCCEIESLRKQAERYEKLRRFELAEYYYPSAEAFDFYVDQLPARGQASVDEQEARVE